MMEEQALLKLNSLADRFPGDGIRSSIMELVSGDDVPQPYRQLLVHHHHMTVTLESHHDCRLHLEILKVRHEGTDYSRKLILRSGPSGNVVMAGIMGIQLQFCSPAVAEEILRGQTPLGRVLIENKVLRSIESEAYFRVTMSPKLREMFEVGDDCEVTYGRIAKIFCDGSPAVELLEIVAPESA